MDKLRKIGLFMPGTPGFFADVLFGVKEFARGRWAVEMGASLQFAEGQTQRWRPDGAIISLQEGNWLPLIERLKIPIVLIGGDALPQFPRILTDDNAIGREAGEYFVERGFRQFAYCGYAQEWSHRRERGYREALAAAGFTCEAFHAGPNLMHVTNIETVLTDWLGKLTKPTALFCCHDRIAMLIGHACTRAGIAVPEQVAILGVDNNPLECDFTVPPISSVVGSARRLGYQAAQLLEQLMDGVAPPAKPLLVAPAGVIGRASTDIYAVNDPDVVAALRYIHEHCDHPMRVTDVAKAVIVTRRMLERKFSAQLNRSPREEIVRAQIARAKDLLIQTNMSALDVSLRSGFRSSSKLSEIFKREVGMSPTDFRRLYGTVSAGMTAQLRRPTSGGKRRWPR